MQLRMVGRRVPSGSLTIVGDLGQASGSWAPRSWDEVVAHLPSSDRRPARRAELTVNYRTPSEVMDVAARVLAVAAPELTPSRSVRQAGVEPTFTAVAPDDADRASTPPSWKRPGPSRKRCPTGRWPCSPRPSMVERVRSVLSSAGKGPEMLDSPLAVLPVQQAKGLEFDSVIVVEPAAIVAEHPHGWRALYLALTRTTRRLQVVSAQPLPAGPGAVTGRGRRRRRCHDGLRARAGGRTPAARQLPRPRHVGDRAGGAPAGRRPHLGVEERGHQAHGRRPAGRHAQRRPQRPPAGRRRHHRGDAALPRGGRGDRRRHRHRRPRAGHRQPHPGVLHRPQPGADPHGRAPPPPHRGGVRPPGRRRPHRVPPRRLPRRRRSATSAPRSRSPTRGWRPRPSTSTGPTSPSPSPAWAPPRRCS